MVSRHSVIAIAAAALLACTAGVTPVRASSGDEYQAQPIEAEFVPTRDQVLSALNLLGDQLEAQRRASFYNGEAAGEYLTASRLYEFGLYDYALDHVRLGERELSDVPNWIQARTAAR